MSLQIIDVGSIANDNTGEPLRNAFVKVNENFSELYTQVLGTGANLIIAGNALEATNTNGNVELVPNGSGVVKMSNVVVDGAQIRCSPIGTLTLDTTTAINNLNVTGGFSVAGASNLGAVTNITITGGVAGYALTTNGSGTLSWSPAALIAGATGTADRLAYFPTTGSNIADTSANLTWTGNNLLTVIGNISTGNVIAGNLTVGADKIVSANSVITIDPSSSGPGGTVIIEGNLQVTGTTTTVNSTTVEVADLNITLAKDAATAAAANGAGLTVAGAGATITYASTGDKWTFNKPIDVTGSIVGSSTLNITGNANVANLGTAGLITATGNVTGGNLITGGALSVTGNATVGNISATNANVTAITATGNANVGNLGTAGLITATGNVTGGNLKTGGILSVTGNATVGNISATNANVTAITATGNANVGNLGAAAGVFTGNITAGNINSVSGILSVTGNANLGNLGAGAGVFTGVVTVTGNLSGGNISTLGVLNVTGNANVGNIGATAAVLAGPLSGATTINASGNANVGNIGSQHSIHTGNGSFGNINSVSGILSVTGNANVGNIGAGAAVLAGPLSGVTTINASGNANVGNIGATNSVVTANATFGNINSVSGILSVTGNANVGNIGATAAVLAGPLSGVTTINASGNANVGNIGATRGVFTSIVGNLETTAQSNITVVGTLTGLTVSGNFNAQANVFVTSNITAGNINSVSGILSVTGNANVGNIGSLHSIHTGNGTFGNINSVSGILSVTGNANVGNLGVAGLITATGNITGANITSNGNISTSNLAVTNLSNLGNVGNVRITGGSADYVLRTDGAGNLSWISAPVISGSVSSGTANQLAYYATTGQTISETGANLTWNGSNLLTVTGNISAGNVSGTLTTAAQPNVTSVGSLSSLTVTGNLSAGNISTTGVLSVTGNANVGNLGATNIVGTLATNAQPNITSVGNLVALNAGLTNITASTDSTSTTSGALVVAGGVGIGGNLNVGAANRAHVITGNVTITGNITVTGNQNIIGSNNVSYTDNILELHNQANSAPWTTDDGKDVGIRVHYYKGADKHAFFGWSNDAQSLEYYYDGTESGGVFSGSYGTFKGNVFHSTATTGTAPFTVNSTTQVANLHAALAGSVTGNAQGNITSVGTLSGLTVSGNITANANVIVTSNITAGNINGVSGILSVTGNANVGNIGAIRGVFSNIAGTLETAAQPSVTSVGTLTSLTVSGGTALATSSGNVGIGTASPAVKFDVQGGRSYFTPLSEPFAIYLRYNSANAGVFLGSPSTDAFQISKSSGAAVFNIDANGNVGVGNAVPTDKLRVEGTLSATGNANVGNIGATRGVFTNVVGTLETAAQTNITSVGTLGSLTVSGNAFLATSSGNVGIGTTSPDSKLQVGDGTAATTLTVYGNVSGSKNSYVRLRDFSGASIGLRAAVGGTETLVLEGGSGNSYFNGGGNVGIGTASPARTLHVHNAVGDNHLYLTSVAPSIIMGNNVTFASSTMYYLMAMATANGQYGLNAGDTILGNYGNSRGNLYINSNYSGTGTTNVILQPGSGSVGIGITPVQPFHVYRTTVDSIGTFQGLTTVLGGTGKGGIQLDVNGNGGYALLCNATSGIRSFTISGNNGYGFGMTEFMRIDSIGNVGIGTTNPQSGKLNVYGKALIGAHDSAAVISGGQLELRSAGATESRLDIWQSGVALGSLGSPASSSVFYIVNNYSTTGLVPGNGIAIATDGKIGIGTASPQTKLHIYTGASGGTPDTGGFAQLVVEKDSDAGIQIINPSASIGRLMFGTATGAIQGLLRWDNTNNTLDLGTDKSTGFIRFLTGSFSERMRIDSSGNVGIGTANPGYTLDVKSSGLVAVRLTNSGASDNVQLRFRGNQTNAEQWAIGNEIATNSTGRNFDIYDLVSGSNRVRIDSSGNVLIGYTTSNGSYLLQVNSQIFATNATIATSDGRYKENISSIKSGLDVVGKLNPVSFTWKQHEIHNFDSGTQVGFIAQDVQAALADEPYLESIVKRNEVELKDGTKEEFYGLSDAKLIPILVKAIQELKAEIDILKAKN